MLKRSLYLLLQTASDDALIRLKRTDLADKQQELMYMYFKEQHHGSIVDFLGHYLKEDKSQDGLLLQVGLNVLVALIIILLELGNT